MWQSFEEAEARRRQLEDAQLADRRAQNLSCFCGQWQHHQTENMDAYLQAFGVGLLRRKAAMAFTPSPRYHVEHGKLCITMSTPLGTRVEWLQPYGPPECDVDPAGHHFEKTVAWKGEALVSTFKSKEISDVITRRHIEPAPEGTGARWMLVQATSFEGVTFTRCFLRVEYD